MNEVDELIARVLSGDILKGDPERLLELLRADPELRRRFAIMAALEGRLGVALEDDWDRERSALAITNALRRNDQEHFVRRVHARLARRWWLPRIAAAAALLLLLLGVGLWQTREHDTPASATAKVVRTETIRWGTGRQYSAGHMLIPGDRIKFEGGLAELDFMDQGRMILEGPAELELSASNRVILQRGRMVVRVTPQGHGFRVETPRGSVIDLGTEFGVLVDDYGAVETHVLQGQVETVANDGNRATLNCDSGLRLDASGQMPIQADSGQFYTAMPPLRSEPLGFIHWSFDDNAGLVADADFQRLGGGKTEMALHSMDEGGLPAWISGVRGAALAFDGKGSYAESGFRGIGGGLPRTVAFWLRVPQDFSLRQGFGILSWGKYDPYRPGEVWQVSVNPIPSDGPVGRLRVGLHVGQVVGSTDLRDGRWHHIAVVLYGGSLPDVGTHVLLYLDGQMETVSRRALREVRTEVSNANHGVWLGRNITYTEESRPTHIQGGFFRGDVDELFIFDSALSQAEIQRLIENNEPSQ